MASVTSNDKEGSQAASGSTESSTVAAVAASVGEETETQLTADDLVGEGKRHLVCNDPQAACECFSRACSMVAADKGDLADELGPMYLLYGKALLEVIRNESTVLGDKLVPGEKEEKGEEEEGKDEEEEGGDADACAEEPATDDAAIAAAAAAIDSMAEAETNGEADAPADAEAGEATDDNDGGDAEVAWQVLDTARVILEKMAGRENQYLLAETHQCIGEFLLEKEDFEQSADELTKSLEIYTTYEPADSRLVAEVHFTLGLAYSMSMSSEQAIKNYEAAILCLKLNIEHQQTDIAEAEKEGEAEGNATIIRKAKSGIEEINTLIPDLLSKIEDQRSVAPLQLPTQEELYRHLMATNEAAAAKAVASSSGSGSSEAGATCSEDPKKTMSGQMNKANAAYNIQHLVRKRKPDESNDAAKKTETPSDEPAAKKLKPPPTDGHAGTAEP